LAARRTLSRREFAAIAGVSQASAHPQQIRKDTIPRFGVNAALADEDEGRRGALALEPARSPKLIARARGPFSKSNHPHSHLRNSIRSLSL
jgi:hypothetical protein